MFELGQKRAIGRRKFRSLQKHGDLMVIKLGFKGGKCGLVFPGERKLEEPETRLGDRLPATTHRDIKVAGNWRTGGSKGENGVQLVRKITGWAWEGALFQF